MSANYLRWVGGKTGVSSQIIPHFPSEVGTYVEPFVGSGAMFFSWYEHLERTTNGNIMASVSFPKKVILCDINSHVVNCHETVRDRCDDVIRRVKELQTEHNSLGDKAETLYKKIRYTVTGAISESNKVELAAQFMYINKTCFNGIWRVNNSGNNNVPFNKRNTINFNEKDIRNASRMLRNAEIRNINFANLSLDTSNENTFVYLDPPYYPISKTSNFTMYNKEKENDDALLAKLYIFCEILDKNNIKWLMSNSDAIEVKTTFSKYKINHIEAHRFVKAIKTENDKRSKIKETLIANY